MPDQVGRRPSDPRLLALYGVVWIGCGIIAILKLHASWKLVPGLVFIGIGLFFIRGALVTVQRRNHPGD